MMELQKTGYNSISYYQPVTIDRVIKNPQLINIVYKKTFLPVLELYFHIK